MMFRNALGWIMMGLVAGTSVQAQEPTSDLLDFEVRRLAGDQRVNLRDEYAGKVLLVVNTASKCAFTGQYETLEALHARYKDQGFAVLGFPSADFGNQELAEEEQIQSFCRTTYGVQFPMFAKAHVKGEQADPFWKALISSSGTTPKWNFYKYLIGRDGRVIDVYSSLTAPDNAGLINEIESAIRSAAPNS